MRIIKPTLLLDKRKCLNNIQGMSDKARFSDIKFRPHFKTHQSKQIGKWFKEFGVDSITVSSVDMAMYFVSDGWKDITIAFPVNLLEIDNINYLSGVITLNIVVESVESVAFLSRKLQNKVSVFIKIDSGYNRTGINYRNLSLISKVLDEINRSNELLFKGFLIHPGHTYSVRGDSEILDIHYDTLNIAEKLKVFYKHEFPELLVSIGDTPSCSVADYFGQVDEIRPGNFVFYDIMQHQIGSCSLDQIAVAMACPVVAKHEDRLEIIIYGGSAHFSKDYIQNEKGDKIFGYMVKLTDEGWNLLDSRNCVTRLSQEHGIIKVSKALFESIKIGELVGVLPVHSCLTANLMGEFYCFDGELSNGTIITTMNK